MNLKIDNIIVKKRIRKDFDDLQPLMDSMNRFGQLSSIAVNSKMELIAGHRRLEAAKRLGWENINGTVFNVNSKSDLLEMEIEENIHRKDFTADEVSDAYKKLYAARKKGFFARIAEFIKNLFMKIFKRSAKEK